MLDEDVVPTIQKLVREGEYLDALQGLPGVRLSGGGAFRHTSAGMVRMYARGSREHLEAKAAVLMDRLPTLLTPASGEEVQRAEEVLDLSLPGLLRRLYLGVSDGGFGPGYGLLGVGARGHVDGTKGNAVATCLGWRSAAHPLPRELFPLCHWGCAIYSFVDCSSPRATVWGWDPNPAPHDRLEVALFRQDITLTEWFERWIKRTLLQPCLVEDERTGEWRGAQDKEMAEWLETETRALQG